MQPHRDHRAGEIRGAFYSGNPRDLIIFSDELRNCYHGKVSISEVRPRNDGDYQILVTIWLKEAL